VEGKGGQGGGECLVGAVLTINELSVKSSWT
jgi:hypothetical protein